jgi:hypothetical protein
VVVLIPLETHLLENVAIAQQRFLQRLLQVCRLFLVAQ